MLFIAFTVVMMVEGYYLNENEKLKRWKNGRRWKKMEEWKMENGDEEDSSIKLCVTTKNNWLRTNSYLGPGVNI
jgi:hypothetical protein